MPLYELKLDPKRRYLQIVLHGYWDEKAQNAYDREEQIALDALARLDRPTHCLVDLSDYPPQAKETVEHTSKRLRSLGAKMPSRVAIIVPGAIVKLQTDRMVPCDGFEKRTFTSREEGEAWLFGEDKQRAVG